MDKEELVNKIRQSKKYKNISTEVVEQKITDYAKKNPNYINYPEKILMKEIKTMLHKIHGSFQISNKKRTEYFEELKKDPKNLTIIDKILETNTSTNERFEIYPELYNELFKITEQPHSILDLGCGLNPIGIVYSNRKNIAYFAYDINEEDSRFLNDFFKLESINGKSKTLDLTRIENIKKLENADVCFMFKLLDVLEKKGHKYSEEIIKILIEKCKFIVVSFATASISGKKMKYAERGWIERMLERINLKFEKISFDSEIFYVISKI